MSGGIVQLYDTFFGQCFGQILDMFLLFNVFRCTPSGA